MTLNDFGQLLGLIVVAAPACLLALIGVTCLVGRPLSERVISHATQGAVLTGVFAALAILILMLATGSRFIPIELGNWVEIPDQHFHLHLKFVFDRLSVPFAILSFVLCGTVAAFTTKYLHREAGYRRFFVCYGLFLLGMIVATLAGTIETLFAGWELVGLSSALLVAYFHERTAPVINGLRVWSVYRVADAAFLVAAVALHHLTGEGDFARLMGTGPWPGGEASLSPNQALLIGTLLLVAAAGKSALIPFSGWLPRAMEGPTPSSAVFYGALSVHLGAFLLLRISPILELSPWLAAEVVVLGLVTAIFATMAARVQSDVKSALAFSSLTQVGIIFAEIGLGLRYIALIHVIGHACLRTLQLLRAPSLLHDYHDLENAIGAHLSHRPGWVQHWLPEGIQRGLFQIAFERGFLDHALDSYFVQPLFRVLRWCATLERRWTQALSGGASTESERTSQEPEFSEEAP